ncbi:MAG TPA: Arm DNA-binding domain-containing protein [Geobacteraceae bacterium]|nr:Arm DNA-binding domain-containing protein [Geobacteraceae bacterium]
MDPDNHSKYDLATFRKAISDIRFGLNRGDTADFVLRFLYLCNICEPTVFKKAYKIGLPARKILFQAIREKYPKENRENQKKESVIVIQKQRLPEAENIKHRKRNPLEIKETPIVSSKNWRKTFDDPAVVFTNLGSRGDTGLCDMADQEARRKYNASGNMLYVLESFFRRVDMLCGGLSEDQIREAKPWKEPFEMHDGGGLFLLVEPDGSKKWYIGDDYIGDYPHYSLSYARCYYYARQDIFTKGESFDDPKELKREIELRIDCFYDDEPDVPIPAWMAQALADGFKQYYSRKFLHGKDITLDGVFGITGDKRQRQFDMFTIDTSKLVEKTREVQWYCNLTFSAAIKHALRIFKKEPEACGDNIEYKFIHADIETVRADESRGRYGNYGEWCKANDRTPFMFHPNREEYMDLMEAIDPKLRMSIEKDMLNPRRRLLNNLNLDIELFNKTREIQWHCNLTFSIASEHALRLLEMKLSKSENIDFGLIRNFRETFCANESLGYYSYKEWCQGKLRDLLANSSERESFLDSIQGIDSDLRKQIEEDMKDDHNQMFPA